MHFSGKLRKKAISIIEDINRSTCAKQVNWLETYEIKADRLKNISYMKFKLKSLYQVHYSTI